MNHLTFDPQWPESWKSSYKYDLMEIYGGQGNKGYIYAYNDRRQQTLELVKRVVAPGAKILDVAAAQGNFTLTLAELGYEVTWNDLRVELVDYVKLKQEKGVVHYAPGNAFELDFDEKFDAVLITEIIEHVAHPDEFLASVAALVKPGGHIIMTTPNGGYLLNKLPKFSQCADPSQFESMQFKPNSDGHIFLLHTDELEPLASKAGLQLKNVQLYTNPLTNGHLKTGILLKFMPSRLVRLIERSSRVLPFPLRRKMHTGMAASFVRPA